MQERVKTYRKAGRRREQAPLWFWKCSVLLEQMCVSGDEAEKKVGLGPKALGCRLKQPAVAGRWCRDE